MVKKITIEAYPTTVRDLYNNEYINETQARDSLMQFTKEELIDSFLSSTQDESEDYETDEYETDEYEDEQEEPELEEEKNKSNSSKPKKHQKEIIESEDDEDNFSFSELEDLDD